MADVSRVDGMVLVAVLLLTLVMSALGVALSLVASSDVLIAANFRERYEARYAAGAAAGRALAELAAVPEWNRVLDGTLQSSLVDGPLSAPRTLADGMSLDLVRLVNVANCRKEATCSRADMDRVTGDRPWGGNNPRWQPFAHGWLRDAAAAGSIDSPYYIVVLAGDDPSETDGNPLQDGAPPSPGAGAIELRAQAFGPRGARRTVDLTLGRSRDGSPRLIAWREPQ